jgi:hypothetical protein
VSTGNAGNTIFNDITPNTSGEIAYTMDAIDDRANLVNGIALLRIVTIPEPSSLLLMGTALAAGLLVLFRRK